MRYHNITTDDMNNGDGLRCVLWVAGCLHACPGCHNPMTWCLDGGIPFDKQAENELFQELAKDHIAGITFSGGDPLHPANRSTITRLCQEIRQHFPSKSIWLYTGYCWEEILTLPLIAYLDVLIDGRYIAEQRNLQLKWVGSSNQQVINVPASLSTGQVVLH